MSYYNLCPFFSFFYTKDFFLKEKKFKKKNWIFISFITIFGKTLSEANFFLSSSWIRPLDDVFHKNIVCID